MLINNLLARSELMIPYGRQDITQVDIDAVVEVLRSVLTQGPTVPRFERRFHYCGVRHGVAVNSATSACMSHASLKSWAWRLAVDEPKYFCGKC